MLERKNARKMMRTLAVGFGVLTLIGVTDAAEAKYIHFSSDKSVKSSSSGFYAEGYVDTPPKHSANVY